MSVELPNLPPSSRYDERASSSRHADLLRVTLRRDAPARVLLLTSGLGLGHVRAAQAIEAALRGAAEVATLDFWSLMNPGVAHAAHATYLRLVQNHPDLYERLYRLDEQTWRQILESDAGPPRAVLEVLEIISGIAAEVGLQSPRGGRYGSDRLLLTLLCTALPYDAGSLAGNGTRARLALMKWTWLRLIRRLESSLKQLAPHVIISTQMIPAAMTAYLKQQNRIDTPLVAVTTDFGVHDFWKQHGVDRYCIAHESLGGSVETARAREIVTGVPLMPEFAQPLSQGEARHELRLPGERPIVLVLGGGLGLSVDAAAAALLERPSAALVVAMAGRNHGARTVLGRLAKAHPLRLKVCEWTDRMDLFLRAADVVVGKPGGITVAEALACGRPLLAARSLGGQEGFNIHFVQRHGVGGLVADGNLAEQVEALLRDPHSLQEAQRRAWSLGRRDGAARIAALALELAMARHRTALQVP